MNILVPLLGCTTFVAVVGVPTYFLGPFRGSDVLLEVPLMDGHNDLPIQLRQRTQNHLSEFDFTSNSVNAEGKWKGMATDLPRLRAGRLGGQFWAAYVPCETQYKDAVETTLEQIDVIKRLVQAYPQHLQFVTSQEGVWDAFRKGKIASLIGVEGGHSFDNRLAVLRLMYEMGVRYVTLTHVCNTPWANSSISDDKETGNPGDPNGLSTFGKLVVMEMNRLGMMVDLSHVSHDVMVDTLKIANAPVIFSHSSAYAVCNHSRNVRDDVLKMMPQNGGVVMVNFYSNFIKCKNPEEATIDDVVEHINHIRKVAGVDHVGIGGDYDGVKLMPQGLEDVSKYVDLFDRLANNREDEPRWTKSDLAKLAGLNVLRVMGAVEQVRNQLSNTPPLEIQLGLAEFSSDTDKSCSVDKRSFAYNTTSIFY